MPYFRFPFPLGDSEMFDYEKEDHDALSERFRKTLYYGKLPNTERPSLPLTDIAVEFLHESTPRKLGRIDHYMMASATRENCISPCTMMMGMIYVNRLRTKNPEYLKRISSSDLFLISMMMASKFMYDEGVDEEVFNDEWADSVDMETEEINQLEKDFLKAIDWNLFIRDEEFSKVLHNMETSIALRQGIERGWFTYTDLWVLSQNAKIMDISQELTKVVLVSSLTYLTGILTMIGSTVLVTAATTSLGPIILHSQGRLLPLPVVDILPITNVNTHENVSQDETVPRKSDEQPNGSLAKESFEYMLAELMTVISLPLNIVKFWYSALDQLNSLKSPSGTDNSRNLPLLCSNGPCLPSASNLNCQNVTDVSSLDFWESCSECQTCQDQRKRRLHHGLDYNVDSPMTRTDMCQNRVPDCAVKCCCSSGTSWTLTDSLSMNVVPHVPVGFNTGHQLPVFVAT